MMIDILVIGGREVYPQVKAAFEDRNTMVYYSSSILNGLKMLQQGHYCLVILDLLLSGDKGGEVLAAMRQMNSVPILALSEDPSEAEKVLALGWGADDIADRGGTGELLARARALLRRYTGLNHSFGRSHALVCHGDLLLDMARRMVSVAGEQVRLTRKEYEILLYFLKNSERVLTYEQIYAAVWHEEYLSNRSVIFYHVAQLRKKLNADWVEAVQGVGYRIHKPVS